MTGRRWARGRARAREFAAEPWTLSARQKRFMIRWMAAHAAEPAPGRAWWYVRPDGGKVRL